MTDTVTMLDEKSREDQVYRMRLIGTSVRAIADHFAISVADVNRIVDSRMVKLDNALRVRAVALDYERLEEMQIRFLRDALKGDVTAGHLVLKIAERRAAMLGTDAPLRVDPVQLIDATGHKPTSTEELQSAIDLLCGRTPPEPQSN